MASADRDEEREKLERSSSENVVHKEDAWTRLLIDCNVKLWYSIDK